METGSFCKIVSQVQNGKHTNIPCIPQFSSLALLIGVFSHHMYHNISYEPMQSIFAVSKSYYSSHSPVYVPAWIIGSHAWKAGSVWIKMSSLGCSNMPADHNLSVTTPTLSAFDWMVNSAQCIQTANMLSHKSNEAALEWWTFLDSVKSWCFKTF